MSSNPQSMPLEGKRALITGSSDTNSIGFAIASSFKAAGATVTLLARDAEKLNAALAHLPASSTTAFTVVGDLNNPSTLESAVEQADAFMGGLDILVVSGGNGGKEYLGLDPTAPESLRFQFEIAVISSMILIETAAKKFLRPENHGGSVVVVGSMAPEVPWPSTMPYNIAKAAQETLVSNLAIKYAAKGIRINCIQPACIHTSPLDRAAQNRGITCDEYAALRARAHPMGKVGTGSDVAHAALYLVSPNASFVTGTFMKVDGGLSLSSWFNAPASLFSDQKL